MSTFLVKHLCDWYIWYVFLCLMCFICCICFMCWICFTYFYMFLYVWYVFTCFYIFLRVFTRLHMICIYSHVSACFYGFPCSNMLFHVFTRFYVAWFGKSERTLEGRFADVKVKRNFKAYRLEKHVLKLFYSIASRQCVYETVETSNY